MGPPHFYTIGIFTKKWTHFYGFLAKIWPFSVHLLYKLTRRQFLKGTLQPIINQFSFVYTCICSATLNLLRRPPRLPGPQPGPGCNFFFFFFLRPPHVQAYFWKKKKKVRPIFKDGMAILMLRDFVFLPNRSIGGTTPHTIKALKSPPSRLWSTTRSSLFYSYFYFKQNKNKNKNKKNWDTK